MSGFGRLLAGAVPSSEEQWNSHYNNGKPNVGCRTCPCQRAIEVTGQQCRGKKEYREASERPISSACVTLFRRHSVRLSQPMNARNRALSTEPFT